MLDTDSSGDPIEDYLVGLELLERASNWAEVLIPGHGSTCGAEDMRARIQLDRAYVHALRAGGIVDDPRIGGSAKPGWEWVSDVVHAGQLETLARRSAHDVPLA